MPIRREYRWLYPIDWTQLSAQIRFARAGGRCESCGRPHGERVLHLGDGRWWDEKRGTWRNGQDRALRNLPRPEALPAHVSCFTTRVVLACAHVDHDPTNNRPRNLKALCQRCHLLHDRAEHQRRRWLTLRRRKALGDLFFGPYPANVAAGPMSRPSQAAVRPSHSTS